MGIENMIQIGIIVEGMKTEIIKCFDVEQISAAIKKATEKAVDEFDMEMFIKSTVESVFAQARENVIIDLSAKYGERWTDDLARIVDAKIEEALEGK